MEKGRKFGIPGQSIPQGIFVHSKESLINCPITKRSHNMQRACYEIWGEGVGVNCNQERLVKNKLKLDKILTKHNSYTHLFALYFGKIKFCWVERLGDTVHCLGLPSFVKSHCIQLQV